MTFSQVLPEKEQQISAILARVQAPSPARTAELLAASTERELGMEEIAELIEIGNDDDAASFALLREFVHHRFRQAKPNRARYIAPIYLSSYCVDACGYCNFSVNRSGAERRRLSLEAFEVELEAVLGAGARVVELVLGTDPEMPWTTLRPYVKRTADRLAGAPGSGVMLCSEHLPEDAYRSLADDGLVGMVQWDETLERNAYHRWHNTSPRKRHFEPRVDCHDRALRAGLEISTGALFGLADYRFEALMQLAKVRFYGAEYGRKPFVLGTARLKPIAGQDLHIATEVSDRAYQTAIMVYKIAEPTTGRWLQTRETLEMNLRNIVHNDAFTFRCGDVTPGGYGTVQIQAKPGIGGQFAVNELTQESAETKLAEIDFAIDYAWLHRS